MKRSPSTHRRPAGAPPGLRALFAALLLQGACDGPQRADFPDGGATAPDGGPAHGSIAVSYGGSSTLVALDRPPPVSFGGVSSVRLSDIVALAVTGKRVDQLQATDFLGGDGYSARSRANCAGVLPVDGAALAQGYVELATRNLTWDAALAYPGCLSVRDTAELRLADK